MFKYSEKKAEMFIFIFVPLSVILLLLATKFFTNTLAQEHMQMPINRGLESSKFTK